MLLFNYCAIISKTEETKLISISFAQLFCKFRFSKYIFKEKFENLKVYRYIYIWIILLMLCHLLCTYTFQIHIQLININRHVCQYMYITRPMFKHSKSKLICTECMQYYMFYQSLVLYVYYLLCVGLFVFVHGVLSLCSTLVFHLFCITYIVELCYLRAPLINITLYIHILM